MSREYPCVYYDNQKCTLHPEPGYTDWCVLGPCSHETPSNADHIRAMTDEELCSVAQILVRNDVCLNPSHGSCKGCAFDAFCSAVHFEEDVLEWLKQPYKEEVCSAKGNK